MKTWDYSSGSDSDSDEEVKKDISNLKKGLQKYTLDAVENIQRKFMETNWVPYSGSEDPLLTQRISHQMQDFKRKHVEKKEMIDTVFLTSFGVLGIYLFYKMLEKHSM